MSRTAGTVLAASVLLLVAMGLVALGVSGMTTAYADSSRGRTPSATSYTVPLAMALALVTVALGLLVRVAHVVARQRGVGRRPGHGRPAGR